MKTPLVLTLSLLLVLPASSALAQQSKRFGPFELHYSVVNTTFLAPEVASAYGITRGDKRAILNLAVREHMNQQTQARPMVLRATSRDLVQRQQELEFQEVRESGAIYYIAEFKFLNEEWLFFDIDFRPEGANETYSFTFKHQLYIN